MCRQPDWNQLLLLVRRVPMFLVMGTIFFLSHQSGDTLSPYLPAFPGADKICHLAIYGLLAMTVLWWLGPGKPVSPVRVALKTVIFCLVYGMSDEFHQSFVPLRSVSGLDLLADLAGAMLVCATWLMNSKLRASMQSWYMILTKRLEGACLNKPA
ncbi:MAG: VanZ family protein [Deltaproteobacteria bacterium]|nr:VanZ family protein [Deltaproteobacteria bacterium]